VKELGDLPNELLGILNQSKYIAWNSKSMHVLKGASSPGSISHYFRPKNDLFYTRKMTKQCFFQQQKVKLEQDKSLYAKNSTFSRKTTKYAKLILLKSIGLAKVYNKSKHFKVKSFHQYKLI